MLLIALRRSILSEKSNSLDTVFLVVGFISLTHMQFLRAVSHRVGMQNVSNRRTVLRH